ncbi:MAG TPA: YolD-like family protein [Pseudogracilibacillus sp.]|nr:YolD-like family protein [Pseudogracilibacillus sp.]
MKISQKNTMKWVSLMLPESGELTNTTFINEAEKPVIDDRQLKEFDRKLKRAIMKGLDIEITYYIDQSFKTVQTQVKSINTEKGFIYIVHGDQTKMPITNIISIELKNKSVKDTTTIYRGAM